MKTGIFVLVLLALAPGAASQAQQPPPPPAGCSSPESRQFDFWVGRWDVYPSAKDTLVATV